MDALALLGQKDAMDENKEDTRPDPKKNSHTVVKIKTTLALQDGSGWRKSEGDGIVVVNKKSFWRPRKIYSSRQHYVT